MKLTRQHAEALPLGDVDMRSLAILIYAALPDFYGALPQEPTATLDMIAAETHVPGTECYNPLIASTEGMCAGMVCSFPMEELRARQQQSYHNCGGTKASHNRECNLQAQRSMERKLGAMRYSC